MKKIWTNKKYKNKKFFGHYTVAKNKNFSDRTFNIKEVGSSGKKVYSFESWQMAVKSGWERV